MYPLAESDITETPTTIKLAYRRLRDVSSNAPAYLTAQ